MFVVERKSRIPFDEGRFSGEETGILQTVAQSFSNKNTGEIVRLSNEEPAWKENEGDRQLIDYQRYAYGVGDSLVKDEAGISL